MNASMTRTEAAKMDAREAVQWLYWNHHRVKPWENECVIEALLEMLAEPELEPAGYCFWLGKAGETRPEGTSNPPSKSFEHRAAITEWVHTR